jgi:hypothetical protein
MLLKQRKKLFFFGFSALTGIAGYGCYLQGFKYKLSKKRWEKLDRYIDTYQPLPYQSLEM